MVGLVDYAVVIGLWGKVWTRDIRTGVSACGLGCMKRQMMTSSGVLLPGVLLPGTARHTFGRDDAVLVTAWRLGADYEVGP